MRLPLLHSRCAAEPASTRPMVEGAGNGRQNPNKVAVGLLLHPEKNWPPQNITPTSDVRKMFHVSMIVDDAACRSTVAPAHKPRAW